MSSRFSSALHTSGLLQSMTRPRTQLPESVTIPSRSKSAMATPNNILIYLLRRDLRLQDNPVFHEIANLKAGEFTHLLPLYIFPAQQLEVSGFIQDGQKSPYPEARSSIGRFWRCGPHRAKFLAESVWDLKETLESVGSGLVLRVGLIGEVVKQMLNAKGEGFNVGGVWMTMEDGEEEKSEERKVQKVCDEAGVKFKLFTDEKYFIDDRDLEFTTSELPDIFTTYRKKVEPLRDAPRAVLPTATSVIPLPSKIPDQHLPFTIPNSYDALEASLIAPLTASPVIDKPPPAPSTYQSAHPFHGGSRPALSRLEHLITSGSMTSYHASRNGLLGTDFSTKLSAYLAHGCLTSRQIHAALIEFEDGTTPLGKGVKGYGAGENDGTKAVRFELLWRDYMHLCTQKFGRKLFQLSGFREDESISWLSPQNPKGQTEEVDAKLQRFLNGTTGMGMIDASQRELYLTGYTSNRARQNVASFLAKRLCLDWRLGAEWYECMLVDHDVSSNWGNWQYVAGVGNDPRGEARVFNPVKQSFDYDPKAEYVRAWIPELSEELDSGYCFQAWTIPHDRREKLGLTGLEWVEKPLEKIIFTVGKKQNGNSARGASRGHRGGNARINGDGGMGRSRGQSRGDYGGRGWGSSRGGAYGNGRGHAGLTDGARWGGSKEAQE